MISDTHILSIVDCLASSKLVVLPTDTIYAISCDASNKEAVELIYQYKRREKTKPLPIFCNSIHQVKKICIMNEFALDFAKKFWPGPLTMVLPLNPEQDFIASNVYNTHQDIAVRIPNSPLILSILDFLKKPLVATSANISGQPPITSAAEATTIFGEHVKFVKGDSKSLASTIIKIEKDTYTVLRQGEISIF